MLCQNCNQKEANVRYTQVINGEKTEMMLCEKCAKELGIGEMKFNMPLSFSNMFGDFLEPELDFMPKLAIGTILKCENCGMTYDEFMNIGKFGCSNCYNAFGHKIEPTLKRIHGSNEYLGKRKQKETIGEKIELGGEEQEQEAKNIDKDKKVETKEEEILKFKNKLKKLIKEENYEEAAKVRDEIKKLEGGDR